MYHWQPITVSSLPKALAPWLTGVGNLTQKLALLSQYRFALLSQALATIPLQEKELLQQTQASAFIRNVAHYLDDEPAVLARTVVSYPWYIKSQAEFDSLGDKPIGQTMLYQHEHIERSAFEFALIAPDAIILTPFINEINLTTPLYARRSIFTAFNLHLLIIEIFMPLLEHYEK